MAPEELLLPEPEGVEVRELLAQPTVEEEVVALEDMLELVVTVGLTALELLVLVEVVEVAVLKTLVPVGLAEVE